VAQMQKKQSDCKMVKTVTIFVVLSISRLIFIKGVQRMS